MLRAANKEDLEEVFQIYMDPSVNPYMSWEVMSLEDFRPVFLDILARNGLYIYQIENNTAAVIRLDRKTHRLSHVAYIGGFGVGSKYQNQGLGSKIMKEIIAKLSNEGVKRIELIVESDNPQAIRLYEKLGFEKEGTLRNYFKRHNQEQFIDDYYMSLLID